MSGLKNIYLNYFYKQAFNPDLFGIFFNPFYLARKSLYNSIKNYGVNITGITLDIGCGQKPYQSLIYASKYFGIEVQSQENNALKKPEVFYNGTNLPFKHNSLDSIVTNQVLEHVFEPEKYLTEINRILKPKGKLLLTVPFVWDEHEQPYDYARYSSFGLKYLLEKHGFKIIEQTKTCQDFGLIMQLINAYLYKILFTNNGIINQLITILIMAPISLLGIILSKILPKNSDLYLDNIIYAEKL